MRKLILAFALAATSTLAACGGTMGGGSIFAPPVDHSVPVTGQIVYNCANGSQIAVDVTGAQAQVAVIGGPSMVLQGSNGTYSNGRYTFTGGGPTATWDTPNGDPTTCRGS